MEDVVYENTSVVHTRRMIPTPPEISKDPPQSKEKEQVMVENDEQREREVTTPVPVQVTPCDPIVRDEQREIFAQKDSTLPTDYLCFDVKMYTHHTRKIW